MARNLNESKVSDEQMEKIMDSCGEELIRLAYFYVQDWQAAEDIVQQAFLAYYQKAHQFENRSSLKTYLSKITINKCHDHLRSWKNKRALFTDTIENLMSGGKSPEENVEVRSGQANLTRKVLGLPIKYREAILLYYYQEFTTKEISHLLNSQENTIKTRMRRAKKLLKDQVDASEWEGFQDEQA
ncbi:RNA polymerase sigma-70 factor, ECF subfamily [Planococcus glaciei]|uniref:sigma-70 family RNA polymerase sigma factor n=1 Tax=Planococcus glaciei TaxID=459472 RepID=UPI0008879CF2|nr:sigma-70 family RNA polymerase sigma factor [Planococcus glaciei]SDI13542.1 RNA polymerase sigma-70 factor, ECF subfamily [Planococcus glaciei]